MTDRPPHDAAQDEERQPALRARIPPLVWIVIFLLVAWFAWAWMQRAGTDVTPHGGTAATQVASPPASAPANGQSPSR